MRSHKIKLAYYHPLFYSYISLQIPAGFVVDRVGPKISMLFSCALLSLALIGWVISPTYEYALVARFMMGVACAPVVVACMGLALGYFPQSFVPWVGIIEMMGLTGSIIADLGFAIIVNQTSGVTQFY